MDNAAEIRRLRLLRFASPGAQPENNVPATVDDPVGTHPHPATPQLSSRRPESPQPGSPAGSRLSRSPMQEPRESSRNASPSTVSGGATASARSPPSTRQSRSPTPPWLNELLERNSIVRTFQQDGIVPPSAAGTSSRPTSPQPGPAVSNGVPGSRRSRSPTPPWLYESMAGPYDASPITISDSASASSRRSPSPRSRPCPSPTPPRMTEAFERRYTEHASNQIGIRPLTAAETLRRPASPEAGPSGYSSGLEVSYGMPGSRLSRSPLPLWMQEPRESSRNASRSTLSEGVSASARSPPGTRQSRSPTPPWMKELFERRRAERAAHQDKTVPPSSAGTSSRPAFPQPGSSGYSSGRTGSNAVPGSRRSRSPIPHWMLEPRESSGNASPSTVSGGATASGRSPPSTRQSRSPTPPWMKELFERRRAERAAHQDRTVPPSSAGTSQPGSSGYSSGRTGSNAVPGSRRSRSPIPHWMLEPRESSGNASPSTVSGGATASGRSPPSTRQSRSPTPPWMKELFERRRAERAAHQDKTVPPSSAGTSSRPAFPQPGSSGYSSGRTGSNAVPGSRRSRSPTPPWMQELLRRRERASEEGQPSTSTAGGSSPPRSASLRPRPARAVATEFPFSDEEEEEEVTRAPLVKRKRGRGRPKGSKNKSKSKAAADSRGTHSVACRICHEGDNLRVTSCGHVFHGRCLESWFEASKQTNKIFKSCPYCGTEFKDTCLFFP